MKKIILGITSAALLGVTFTGCGSSNVILDNYNNFVNALNNADYETAYEYIDTSQSLFMDVDAFEESTYSIETSFNTATKAKKQDYGWEFTTSTGTLTYKVTSDNKLIIPELYTELELYVPTGSTCTYNSVSLTSDMISYSDEVETTYTITAPVSTGVLHIDTVSFGSSEREVDPALGDFNDFTLSSEYSQMYSDIIVDEITTINILLEDRDDTTKIEKELGKFVAGNEVQVLLNKILDNRKLEDTFTSYHNAKYTVTDISINIDNPTTITASVGLNVVWEIGEGKESSMTTNGIFTLSNEEGNWKTIGVNNWDFMYLSALGG